MKGTKMNVEKLIQKYEEIKNNFKNKKMSFYEMELSIEQVKKEFGKQLEKDICENFPEDIRLSSIPCECGYHMHIKDNVKKKIQTMHQMISYKRKYFVCDNCGKKIYPQDEKLGLTDIGRYSPRLNAVISRLDSDYTFGECSDILADLFDVKVSSTGTERAGERMGENIISQKTCHELTAEDQEACDRTYIFIDGKHAPFRPTKEEASQLKNNPKYKRIYHEVKGSVVVKQFANGQEKVYYINKYCDSQSYGKYLDRYLIHLGILNSKEVIIIADGAEWIWKWAYDCYPNSTKIIDWYHAVEYLVKAIQCYKYTEEAKETKEYNELVGLMELGNIEELISILYTWCRSKKTLDISDNPITRAYIYFRNHSDMMNYDIYEEKGYYIGSGRVESMNKWLIDKRFCGSGMAWSKEDINKILILRTLIANKRFKQYLYQRFRVNGNFTRI